MRASGSRRGDARSRRPDAGLGVTPGRWRRASAVIAGTVALLLAPGARAQTIFANRMLESLTLELHSVRDRVHLYIGDPQELLRLQTHPGTGVPRVELGPGPHPTMQIRDLVLFEPPPPPETVYEHGEEVVEEAKPPVPEAQTWDVRIAPGAPTEFILRCEGGSGDFDMTDLQVKRLYVRGDSTDLRVEFTRPNRVELEQCQLTAEGGKLAVEGALNARPKHLTIQCRDTDCDVRITGKPFVGEAEIFFEGTPKSLRIAVSRQIGVRLEGPASTIGRFDAENIERRQSTLYTRGYDDQRCKVLLHFAEPMPKLKAVWE
jgi:hypothetical protein